MNARVPGVSVSQFNYPLLALGMYEVLKTDDDTYYLPLGRGKSGKVPGSH